MATRNPKDHDIHLLDNRGGATGWLLCAQATYEFLGIEPAQLRELWHKAQEGRQRPPELSHAASWDVLTWNMQGKGLADLGAVLSEMPVTPDILLPQEVGGEPSHAHWAPKVFVPDGLAAFYTALLYTPPQGCRGVAIVGRTYMMDLLKHVFTLSAGLGCEFAMQGMKIQVLNVHLPHPKRADADEVAEEMASQIAAEASKPRYFDHVIIGGDMNLDLQQPCNGSLRSACIRALLQVHGSSLRNSDSHTWFSKTGSSRRDFFIDSLPATQVQEFQVLKNWRLVIGSDHDPVFMS